MIAWTREGMTNQTRLGTIPQKGLPQTTHTGSGVITDQIA